MYFEIEHMTHYRYSVPVELGGHLLRFFPMQNERQRILRVRLEIDPSPVNRVEGVDDWGNAIQRITFAGVTDHLEIRARLESETSQPALLHEPTDFGLPLDYGAAASSLAAYLQPLEQTDRLRDFLDPLLRLSGNRGLEFLSVLNTAVNRFYHQGVRLEGLPHSPAETLALGEGVCRDLTVLFMAACRQLGIASRFVSGYQQGEGSRLERYLHAWSEVYLPGVGWRGYDPTHGEVVGGDHLAVAAAPTPGAVTPVEGGYSFVGPELTNTLETKIYITTR